MTGQTLTVEQDRVFGNVVYRPKCENGKKFADLLGKKTLSRYELRIIKSMGMKVIFTCPEPDLG